MFGQVCHRMGLETGLFLCLLGDVWAGVPQKGLEVQVVVFSLFPG